MKGFSNLVVLAACEFSVASGVAGSPVAKVLTMLSDLQQKIIAEGETAQKAYEESSEFCSDRNKQLNFEVKTGKSQVAEFKAAIAKESADIEQLTATIEDLGGSAASAEAKLKAATSIRKKESKDFAAVEADLVETIDTIKRAGEIIGREMQKGASFTQLGGARGLVSALQALVQASSVRSADAARLTALVQAKATNQDEDEDAEAAAPDAAAYENSSGGIVDVLEDLGEKADDELADARKNEAEAQHNYAMMKQALDDEIKFASLDMDAAKKNAAAAAERKATSEGGLAVTSNDLAEDVQALDELHHDCMSKASDFEAETVSRSEELKALAQAKKVLAEATGGGSAGLSQLSLLQEASSSSSSRGLRAVDIVRQVAAEQHSPSFGRLALRMESLLQSGASQPFDKVKGMIASMITKLESEGAAAATHKAFCDKAMAEATAEKATLSTSSDKLSVKIEQATAASTELRENVAVLQSDLAKMAHAQADMDAMRAEEKAAFEKNKAELESGLEGIRLALKIIRDYYGAPESASHSTSDGAASGIVSLIEVCETDYSRGLVGATAVEENAQIEYDAETKQMGFSKLAKEKDVTYKNKEATSLDKASTEMVSDYDRVNDQLSAVLEGLSTLEKQCVAKADTYEERTARRQAELDGLKSALVALGDDGAASLLQSGRRLHGARSGALRGGVLRAA